MLADALHHAIALPARAVFDLATLTGRSHASGITGPAVGSGGALGRRARGGRGGGERLWPCRSGRGIARPEFRHRRPPAVRAAWRAGGRGSSPMPAMPGLLREFTVGLPWGISIAGEGGEAHAWARRATGFGRGLLTGCGHRFEAGVRDRLFLTTYPPTLEQALRSSRRCWRRGAPSCCAAGRTVQRGCARGTCRTGLAAAWRGRRRERSCSHSCSARGCGAGNGRASCCW